MPALDRATFTQILFPPTILTPGREIDVRVMRPERPTTAKGNGNATWSRPQPDRREWFASAEQLALWKAPQDRHVWVGGAVREGRDGTKAGVVASACVWADLDEGGEPARDSALAELERLGLLPTLIVGSSPGKYHFWWRLSEPIALVGDEAQRPFERVLAAIAARIGGDRAVVDCSRVLRLPGTHNVKPWYDVPAPVEVLQVDPSRQYPFARFVELIVPPASKRQKGKEPGATPSAKLPDINPAIPMIATLPHLDRCAFVNHCGTHAATLPEPLWTALSWTLAPSGEAGDVAFHGLSRAHPQYDASTADAKLRYAREHGYQPPSCRKLGDIGFTCPKMDSASGVCTLAPVRSPAALITQGPASVGTGFIRGGRTWRFNGQEAPTLVADFAVRFTDEIVLPEGTKRLGLEAVTPGGRVHRLELPGESLADPKDFGRRLAGAMGTDYRGLDARNLNIARDAWLATSEIRRLRVSHDFGFAQDGTRFVGIDLAVDGEVRFEVPTALASHLGLRTAAEVEVNETLRCLLDRWPVVACGDLAARAMLGVGMWALVAPVLEARDGGVSPLCAWVTGPSGQGKSTSAATLQCLFGAFGERGRLVSFGSTPFSIEDSAHDFRGALMVIDDAKESVILPGQRAAIIGVLQRLHDRTGRARLRSDGAQQRARGCRATVLVNGEDVLFQEASVRARYFALPASAPLESNDSALRVHDQLRRSLSGVTAAIVNTLIGAPAWFDHVHRGYLDERIRLDGVLPKGDNRPRVAASAAAIIAGWRLLVRIAQSRGVIAIDDADRRVDDLRVAVTALAVEQVIRTASLSPGERYLCELRQLVAADVLRIDGLSAPSARGIRVGFVREHWIGVFPEISVTRINEFLHRDGDKLQSAETISTSLAAIGAIVAGAKGRIAGRKGDPMSKVKVPVWLIKHERLNIEDQESVEE